MADLVRFGVSLEKELLTKFDKHIKESHPGIRETIRKTRKLDTETAEHIRKAVTEVKQRNKQ